MFLLVRFAKFYQYKIEEVLDINTFMFFKMYKYIKIYEAEQDLRMLSITDNHLYLKSQNTINKYDEIYKEKREFLKEVIHIEEKTDIEGLKALKRQQELNKKNKKA